MPAVELSGKSCISATTNHDDKDAQPRKTVHVYVVRKKGTGHLRPHRKNDVYRLQRTDRVYHWIHKHYIHLITRSTHVLENLKVTLCIGFGNVVLDLRLHLLLLVVPSDFNHSLLYLTEQFLLLVL